MRDKDAKLHLIITNDQTGQVYNLFTEVWRDSTLHHEDQTLYFRHERDNPITLNDPRVQVDIHKTCPETINAVVAWTKEKHETVAGAKQALSEQHAARQTEQSTRKFQNEFLKLHGYVWRKKSFYVEHLRDTVSRWFLLNPEGVAVLGCRDAGGYVQHYGDLNSILTELGFYSDAAVINPGGQHQSAPSA